MFTHLLVPLDGSSLAEVTLPIARYLARQLGARVTLLHVLEHDAPEDVHHERHLAQAADAQAYLDALVARDFPAPFVATCHVHAREVRDVARSIIAHAEEHGADLIVLCTHGSVRARDRVQGSIAQQVVAHGNRPVLLVGRRATTDEQAFACRNVLVALDGQAAHEQSLPVAADLARACGAALRLMGVAPTRETLDGESAAAGRLLPATTGALLDLLQEQMAAYLEERCTPLRAAGISATYTVGRGDPVAALLEAEQAESFDLIVLATHGKVGLDGFWSGSVTPRLTARAHVPLLLVPVRAGD
jgi:nucleotide-binding universal stress UspA family protein